MRLRGAKVAALGLKQAREWGKTDAKRGVRGKLEGLCPLWHQTRLRTEVLQTFPSGKNVDSQFIHVSWA